MDAGTRVVSCAPEVGQTWIALRLPDPGREFDSVRLSGDSALTRNGQPLVRVGEVRTGGSTARTSPGSSTSSSRSRARPGVAVLAG